MIDHEPDQSAVRQQGDRGTCVGFAVSAGHEWMRGEAEVCSAEDAMWAGHKLMDPHSGEETSVDFTLVGLENHGHVVEAAWPYGNPRWNEGRPMAALEVASQRTLPIWRRLDRTRFGAIRAELAADNAVVLTIGVVRDVWLRGDGAIDAAPGAKVAGNHAILVVGASEEGEQPQVLKFKNSWSAGWGKGGYGFISSRYLNAYGICAHAIERKR